jgi:DNA-binding CsgD family transcriptional regulator
VASTIMARRHALEPLGCLTAREREVLTLMAEDRSSASIAAQLFITEKAVGKHSDNIFANLELAASADHNARVLAVLAHLGVLPETMVVSAHSRAANPLTRAEGGD